MGMCSFYFDFVRNRDKILYTIFSILEGMLHDYRV